MSSSTSLIRVGVTHISEWDAKRYPWLLSLIPTVLFSQEVSHCCRLSPSLVQVLHRFQESCNLLLHWRDDLSCYVCFWVGGSRFEYLWRVLPRFLSLPLAMQVRATVPILADSYFEELTRGLAHSFFPLQIWWCHLTRCDFMEGWIFGHARSQECSSFF